MKYFGIKKQKINIKCPACSKDSEFEAHVCIDATEENGLKKKVLDGSLFMHTCPFCKQKINVEYSFLYNQPEDAFLVHYLVRDDEAKAVAEALTSPNKEQAKLVNELAGMDYIIRLVRSKAELLEKIQVYDCGMDDRVVEIFKAIVAGNFIKDNPGKKLDRVIFNLVKPVNEAGMSEQAKRMAQDAFEDGYVRVVQFFVEKKLFAQASLSPDNYKKIYSDFVAGLKPLRADRNLAVGAKWATEILKLRNAQSNPGE